MFSQFHVLSFMTFPVPMFSLTVIICLGSFPTCHSLFQVPFNVFPVPRSFLHDIPCSNVFSYGHYLFRVLPYMSFQVPSSLQCFFQFHVLSFVTFPVHMFSLTAILCSGSIPTYHSLFNALLSMSFPVPHSSLNDIPCSMPFSYCPIPCSESFLTWHSYSSTPFSPCHSLSPFLPPWHSLSHTFLSLPYSPFRVLSCMAFLVPRHSLHVISCSPFLPTWHSLSHASLLLPHSLFRVLRYMSFLVPRRSLQVIFCSTFLPLFLSFSIHSPLRELFLIFNPYN